MESKPRDIKLVAEQPSSSVPVLFSTRQHATTRTTRHTTRHEMIMLVAMLVLGAANAMPRYIAVPADQIEFLDLAALQAHSRLPRQALVPPPPPQQFQEFQQQPYAIVQDSDAAAAASDERPARHAQHHEVGDYVDFGAHTGQHGAFGWYADYPIHGHH